MDWVDVIRETERLKEEDEAAKRAAKGCWMTDGEVPIRVSIYGDVTDEQRRRLLDLLIEIEESNKTDARPS